MAKNSNGKTKRLIIPPIVRLVKWLDATERPPTSKWKDEAQSMCCVGRTLLSRGVLWRNEARSCGLDWLKMQLALQGGILHFWWSKWTWCSVKWSVARTTWSPVQQGIVGGGWSRVQNKRACPRLGTFKDWWLLWEAALSSHRFPDDPPHH